MAEKKKTKTKAKAAPRRKAAVKTKAKAAPKVKAARKPTGIAKDLLIKVCFGNGGLAAGSQEVLNEFVKQLEKRKIKAEVARMCVNKTGCRGFCAKDVIVEVNIKDDREVYQRITPEKVERIVEEHITDGEPVFKWLVSEEYYAFHDKQTKVLLEHCGQIDPENIDAYTDEGG